MPAGYYRGFLLEANTANATKAFNIREADTNAVHEFSGPVGNNNICHNGQCQIPYTFTTPFVAHLLRYEEGSDGKQIEIYGIKWDFDPWPELTDGESGWLPIVQNGGAAQLRGFIAPCEANGAAINISVVTDANATPIVPTTSITPSANVKTGVPFALASPVICHQIKIVRNANCRIWENEIDWDATPWPELTDSQTRWMSVAPNDGAALLRGFLMPCEANGSAPSISIVTDVSATPISLTSPVTPRAGVKSPVPFALSTPVVCHQVKIVRAANCRIWDEEITWDANPWPETTDSQTGWMSIQPNGAAGFLQGFIAPFEANGSAPDISIITDVSATPITLTSTVTPRANVKTPVAFSLTTPVICHQVKIVRNASCRIWESEIVWIAEATPESAPTWKTQPTSHGMSGFHSVVRIDAVYSSNATATLALTAYDGTSPSNMTLASTSGAKRKVTIIPTYNKGMLYTYAATSASPLQLFLREWTVWVAPWGRKGSAIPYRALGGPFDDSAMV